MSTVYLIPISAINILNPRSRNKATFENIVRNIAEVGLKVPITVRLRAVPLEEKLYDLGHGEGRLRACERLGHQEIPAFIENITPEQAFDMSLVENIARRHHRPLERLNEINRLQQTGLATEAIASRLGLSHTYINGIMQLLEKGERTLINEVESGRIPIKAAMMISTAGDHDVQSALREAYNSGELRGRQLGTAKRLLAQRRRSPEDGNSKRRFSPRAALREYRQSVAQYQSFIKRARHAERNLLLVVTAVKRLLDDGPFVTLLRTEHLDSVPNFLLGRVPKG
jgi:ParB family chromosome partitioning protein